MVRVSDHVGKPAIIYVGRLGYRKVWLLATFVVVFLVNPALAQELLPIGAIQGRDSASEFQDRMVHFRGIVTGILEDENSQGTRFYTVFVQDVPGTEDGDPLTSDGIAIFAGARRPALAPGDIAAFSGRVTEFYGLTELDNNDLNFTLESRNNPLPDPPELEPPADNALAAAYLERFEAMRVRLPRARVVGPAHVGCGFQVIRVDAGLERVLVNHSSDPTGQIVGVLHFSDVECEDMPDVAFADEVEGLVGPLTFHFDRFKIVYQNPAELLVENGRNDAAIDPPQAPAGGLVIATFNVSNYFDSTVNSGHDGEPQPSQVELALKQSKLAATIGAVAGCPAILGLQEVENKELLVQLAEQLDDYCDYRYQISHLDSPDARGAETALLSDPRHFTAGQVQLRQGCTDLDTGIEDPDAPCQAGQSPLFSRPPLQVDGLVEGQRFTVLVNHFKSKRGGVQETAARRMAQANHLRQLVEEIQSADPAVRIVVLGDFNDYAGSELMYVLSGKHTLVDGLQSVPPDRRYSYIFDGASQLIDWILVSPSLVDNVVGADILHTNSDYPFRMAIYADEELLGYRSSDHDIPYVLIDLSPVNETARLEPTAVAPRTDSSPPASPATTTARADSPPTPAAIQTVTLAASSSQGSVQYHLADHLSEPTVTAEPQRSTHPEASESDPVAWGVILVGVIVTAGIAVLAYRHSGRRIRQKR